MIGVAFFKNPVNIWIPSSLSQLQSAGVGVKLVSSTPNAAFFAKECGMFTDEDLEFPAKEFYEKGQTNKMWLDSKLGKMKVLHSACKVHKYTLIDQLLSAGEETMLVTNKPDDRATLTRAHLGVAKLDPNNSCLVNSANILLS